MEDFLNFVADVMGVDASELDGNTTRNQYHKWDSLMHMRLVMEIEQKYDVEIPIEDMPNIMTINDLYKYVNE